MLDLGFMVVVGTSGLVLQLQHVQGPATAMTPVYFRSADAHANKTS